MQIQTTSSVLFMIQKSTELLNEMQKMAVDRSLEMSQKLIRAGVEQKVSLPASEKNPGIDFRA